VAVNLEALRQDAETFVRATLQEYYENGAGLKEELNTAPIYARYAHLFEPEVIVEVRDMGAEASGEEGRRLRYLLAFLTSDHLERAVSSLSDRIATEEAKAEVRADGETLPFRLAAVALANEDDRGRRAALFEARNAVIRRINEVARDRMERLHALARQLGYADYAQLFAQTKGLELPSLLTMTDDLLRRTQKLYEERMGEHLGRIGLSLAETERHDIAYLFRGKAFDAAFAKDRALPTLKASLKGLGFDLDRQPNIRVDAEERPKKSPRAFCAPLDVPDEVYLVAMPRGGHDDYVTLHHEAGHAEHFAHTRRDAPFEFKHLGDNSVTEGFAFVLEYVTTEPGWLRRYVPDLDVAAYLDFAYTYKLHFLRRYAAKLRYELRLHTEGVEGMDAAYVRELEAALGYRHPPEHYLVDVDDGLYAAQYLRAWIFDAQMRAALREKFGEDWWRDEGAGGLLADLWSSGQKYDVGEMAQHLGYAGLDIEPLLEEFDAAWSVS
jgi:hypothetical protein